MVDCDHVVRYLFDSDQYLLLQLASFVGTVSTLFFGLTTYLGNCSSDLTAVLGI